MEHLLSRSGRRRNAALLQDRLAHALELARHNGSVDLRYTHSLRQLRGWQTPFSGTLQHHATKFLRKGLPEATES